MLGVSHFSADYLNNLTLRTTSGAFVHGTRGKKPATGVVGKARRRSPCDFVKMFLPFMMRLPTKRAGTATDHVTFVA
jgi:hypothetical protein